MSAQNLRHSLRLVLVWTVEFVVCFVADSKVIPEGWVVTFPCRHEFRFMSRCEFSTSGVSHGGFLIVLDM